MQCPRCQSVYKSLRLEPGQRFACKVCGEVMTAPAEESMDDGKTLLPAQKPEPRGEAKPKLRPKLKPRSERKPKPKLRPKGERKPKAKLRPKGDREPEAKPKLRPKARFEPEAEPKPPPRPEGVPLQPTALQGREVGGCRVESLLGRGGMGTVYLARQLSLNRPVALKMLPPAVGDNREYIARFEREARSVARLNNIHIVSVHDMGRDETGRYFIIMEYVEGESIGDRLKRGERFPEREALELAAQAAEGLAEAHKAGVIHRDVKPDNLMLDRRGRVKVADFGLARAADGSVDITRSGSTLGTPAYMAPEQGAGETVDDRADVYALGATLFHMVAGRKPYEADSVVAMLMKHATEPVPRLRKVMPEASPATEKLIATAMAKKPDRRFGALAFAVECRAVAIAVDTSQSKAGMPARGERPSGPKRPSSGRLSRAKGGSGRQARAKAGGGRQSQRRRKRRK